jgi:dTDP-4-dehydrorhamnose reductase
MKVLILGANGQLGQCLADQFFGTDHDVRLSYRADINLMDLELTRGVIKALNPDVVINASGYTAVDKAESEPVLANLVNHLAVANLAKICNDIDSVFIHFSTDYVFDGQAQQPYMVDDVTSPLGVYGKTKWLGEVAIQKLCSKYLVIRTSWVFSEYGSNFLKSMVRLGKEKKSLSIVGDQFGCPTYAQDIAKATVTIVQGIEENINCWGVYHYCGSESASWFTFASYIFNDFAMVNSDIATPFLSEITTDQFPTLAMRPLFSVLDSSSIIADWKVQESDWKSGVTSVLAIIDLTKNI